MAADFAPCGRDSDLSRMTRLKPGGVKLAPGRSVVVPVHRSKNLTMNDTFVLCTAENLMSTSILHGPASWQLELAGSMITLVTGAAAAGAKTGTCWIALVGLALALADAVGWGLVCACVFGVLPPRLAKTRTPVPSRIRTTTAIAAGINHAGRADGDSRSLTGALRLGAGAGARGIGGAATAALLLSARKLGAGSGGAVEVGAGLGRLNSSGTGWGTGVASPVHSELETWVTGPGPGVHWPVSSGVQVGLAGSRGGTGSAGASGVGAGGKADSAAWKATGSGSGSGSGSGAGAGVGAGAGAGGGVKAGAGGLEAKAEAGAGAGAAGSTGSGSGAAARSEEHT